MGGEGGGRRGGWRVTVFRELMKLYKYAQCSLISTYIYIDIFAKRNHIFVQIAFTVRT